MSLPVGISTCTVTFGSDFDFLGGLVAAKIIVQPTHDVVWSATGQRLVSFGVSATATAGVPGSIALPHVDQAGFTDGSGADFTMWAYTLVCTYTGPDGSREQVTKAFQPLVGQSTVDFDNIPGGTISIPVTAPIVPVTSVDGDIGAVDLTGTYESQTAAAATAATKVDKDTLVYVLNEHGGVADAVELDDIAVTTGTNQFTSASANFTSADIGKAIGFQGAGTSGGSLTSSPSGATRTIASVIDAHTATFDDPTHGLALTTVVGPRTCTVTTTRGSQTITSADAAFTASDAGKKITIPGAFGDAVPTLKSRYGQIKTATDATLKTLETDAVWTTADVGKYILVSSAGASGIPLLAKVLTRVNASKVTVDTAASQQVFASLSAFTGQGATVIMLGTAQSYTTKIALVTDATHAVIRRMADFPVTTVTNGAAISGGLAAYGTDNQAALAALLPTLPDHATLEVHGMCVLGHSNVTISKPITIRGRNRKLDGFHSIVTSGRLIAGSSHVNFREIGLRGINGTNFFANATAGSAFTDWLFHRVLLSGIGAQLSAQNSVGPTGTITAAGTGHSARVLLREVDVTDTFGDGLRLTGIDDLRVADLDVHDCGIDVNSSVGIKVAGCRRPKIRGVRLWLNAGDGCDFYDSQAPKLVDVSAWLNGSHGIDYKWNSTNNYNGPASAQIVNCEGSFNYGGGINLSAPSIAASSLKAIGNAAYGVQRAVGASGTVLSAGMSSFSAIEAVGNGTDGILATGGAQDTWSNIHAHNNAVNGFNNGGTDTTLIGVKAFDNLVSSTSGNIWHASTAARPRQIGCTTSDTNGQFTAHASATFILANHYGEEAAGNGNQPTTASWPAGALVKNTSDSTYWHRTFSGWVAGTAA